MISAPPVTAPTTVGGVTKGALATGTGIAAISISKVSPDAIALSNAHNSGQNYGGNCTPKEHRALTAMKMSLSQITDPQTLPDFQTWMKVVSQRGMIAYFYLDGIIMSLSFDPTILGQEGFDRYDAKLDFNEWGQYMMRITFKTTRYSIRNDIYNTLIPDGYDTDKLHAEMDKIRADLPEYWQRYRRIELAKRQNEEARLAKQGYRIDINYQDPDLLPYLQKEPKF